MSAEIRASGPVFDGRAEQAAKDFAKATGQAVAEHAETVVKVELGKVLKHPTGRYSSRIQAVERSGGHVVTDGGVVYGPWLAGKSSKNNTTRFKGYQHWRRSAELVEQAVPEIARTVLPPYLKRMGG